MRQEVVQESFYVRGLVSEGGYEWLDGTDGKRRLLAKRVNDSGLRRSPLEPGAFLEFAALGANEDDIRIFADKYGPLSDSFNDHQTVVRKDKTVAFGDTFGTWTKEAGDMAALVALWRAVTHRNLKALKQIIEWRNDAVSYEFKTPMRRSSAVIAHTSLDSMDLQRYRRGDVLRPAKEALRIEVNKRLADTPPEAVLLRTPEGEHRLVLSPLNLLGALRLQFAHATVGAFELYPCEGCGKFFQRGPGGRRADATTCGDACRQRKKRLGQ